MDTKEIIKILKKDGIGILPTDTLYGLVGRAESKDAVQRIYKVKGRDDGKPLIILISSFSDFKKFGIDCDLKTKALLEKFWPGKVSVILSCENKELTYLHRGTKSLAFRFPHKKSLLEILKKTGPLVAPSANPQGLSPALTISEAKKYFHSNVDFYFSEGKKTSQPSTLVSFTDGELKILRQGAKKIKW